MLHWDAMMAELLWMQNDFINERKYKVKKAKDLGRGVLQTLRKKGACWPVWLWLWLWWHSTDLWFKTLLLLCVHCLCIVCALSVHCLCIVCVCAERQQQRLKTERKVKVVKKCKLVAKAVQSFWKKVDKIVTFKNQATVSMVVVPVVVVPVVVVPVVVVPVVADWFFVAFVSCVFDSSLSSFPRRLTRQERKRWIHGWSSSSNRRKCTPVC